MARTPDRKPLRVTIPSGDGGSALYTTRKSVTIYDPESGVGILVTQSVGVHGPRLTYVSVFPYDAARKVYAQDAGRDPGDNMTAYGTED